MMFRLYVLLTFGPMRLAAIGHRDVRGWVADLAVRDFAPSTITKAYQLLSKVLGAAVDAGAIGRNPCHRVPLPKVEREEMRFLTPVEIHRLADAIRPQYRALVLLGAYGGLRIGELAGLRRRRVDRTCDTVEIAEIVTEVRGVRHIGPPKTRPTPAAAESASLDPSSTRYAPTWPAPPIPTASCSPRLTAVPSASLASGPASGDRPPEPPAWTDCASTTCATLRSRCGSPPAATPRRSPPAPATPRSASPSTATATSTPSPTHDCASGWTTCSSTP